MSLRRGRRPLIPDGLLAREVELMSTFQSDVAVHTATLALASPANDIPGLQTAQADPLAITKNTFLSNVTPAIYQKATPNATYSVTEFVETVKGVLNLTVASDRLEWVQGKTTADQWGGAIGTYGDPEHDRPDHYVYSQVYEGYVTQLTYSQQSDVIGSISESFEFGERQITRLANELTTVNGDLIKYVYGDTHSFIEAGAAQACVIGTQHDTNHGVFQVTVAGLINALFAFGLHLQTRPGAELSFTVAALVIAISEALLGFINISGILSVMMNKGYTTRLNGVGVQGAAADFRFGGFLRGILRI